MKRKGRPTVGVAASTALVTERVRHLIDGAHGGNVHEASKVSGVPSATLRALYSGRNVNPELRTLEALAGPYGISPGWFSDAEAVGWAPPIGINVVVRVLMENGNMHNKHWLFIPWASWPLPDVYNRLLQQVVGRGKKDRHPLIADTKLDPQSPTDIYEVRAKVAEFLLAPFDKARLLVPELEQPSRVEVSPAMVRRMRALGIFWQDTLGEALGE